MSDAHPHDTDQPTPEHQPTRGASPHAEAPSATGQAIPEAPAIPEVYYIENMEQLRAIADPLRGRIFEALARRPLTVTQVGALLGEAPAKTHYHVRELERVGLLNLVETRERGGILEKYYRAVARVLATTPSLLQGQPDAVVSAARDAIQLIAQGFLRALARYSRQNATESDPAAALLTIDNTSVWVTPAEYQRLMAEVFRLLAAYNTPRGVPGEREALLALIGYDTRLAQESASEGSVAGIEWPETPGSAESAESATPNAEPGPPSAVADGSRAKRVSIVGALVYSRADLELLVAQGQRLDLNVLGYLAFTKDVTPDLIERAILRLRYQGVLNASDAVRAALKAKQT